MELQINYKLKSKQFVYSCVKIQFIYMLVPAKSNDFKVLKC